MTDSLPPPLPDQSVAPASRGLLSFVLSMIVIAGCIGFVLWHNDLSDKHEKRAAIRRDAIFDLVARYAVGYAQMLKLGPPGMAVPIAELEQSLVQPQAKPADAFRRSIVSAVLREQPWDEEVMAAHVKKLPELAEDWATLQALQSDASKLDPAMWQSFVKRHGWIAKLARAHVAGWKGAGAEQVRREAFITMGALLLASMVGFGALFLGVVLLVRLLLRWRKGLITIQLVPAASRWAGPLISGFAFYIFVYAVGLWALAKWWVGMSSLVAYGVALLAMGLAMAWPRLRGMSVMAWRHQLGLHRGEGVLREVGHGIAGWITGLPLLAAGALLAPLISRYTGQAPIHPIVDALAEPGWGRWGLIALAVIWAPITEEITFRGLLFPGLSARWRWIAGAVSSAFIFAVVHPQGWAGVPAIMAIAVTMCWLRATRGSLIPSMTAHALNNGLVTGLMMIAL